MKVAGESGFSLCLKRLARMKKALFSLALNHRELDTDNRTSTPWLLLGQNNSCYYFTAGIQHTVITSLLCFRRRTATSFSLYRHMHLLLRESSFPLSASQLKQLRLFCLKDVRRAFFCESVQKKTYTPKDNFSCFLFFKGFAKYSYLITVIFMQQLNLFIS